MSSPYLGEIRMFGGNFAPYGWHFCDGSLLAISSNDALYSLLGTTYGGDGQNTFGLPDLRGRVPIHQGTSPHGTYVIGQISGTETVSLTVGQLPVHSHRANGQAAGGGAGSPRGQFWASNGSTSSYTTNTSPPQSMANGAIGIAGSSAPHSNIMPFQAISFIIALQGLYPARS